QVAPIPRPSVGESVTADKRVDQLVALIGIAIGNERPDRIHSWNRACRIEIGAPDELLIGGECRVRHLVFFHPAKDELVAEVPAGDPLLRRGPARAPRDHVTQAAGVLAVIRFGAENSLVRFFVAILFCRRWRLRQRRGNEHDKWYRLHGTISTVSS